MSTVDHFAVEGSWWLPQDGNRRVPGTLTFDDDGLRLVLYDALREFVVPERQVVMVGPPEWEVLPIVHGRTHDGRDATLLDVGGANLVGPFDQTRETYRAEFAVFGHLTSSDQFSEVWCEFDALDAWSDPPSLRRHDGGFAEIQVGFETVDLERTTVDGDTLRLVTGVQGTAGDTSVHLDRWTAFAVDLSQPRSVKEILGTRIRPLQDLLVMSLGRSVRLISLRLRPVGIGTVPDLGDAYFEALQPNRTATVSTQDIHNYASPTLLTRRDSPVPLGPLLTRWFAVWVELRSVIVLLLGPYYAPFMYSEHRFGATFQAAEALHRARFSTRELGRAAHRDRVDDIVKAARSAGIDDDVVSWAERVLRSRNDKPLSKAIDDLVAAAGDVGREVTATSADFARIVSGARTGVSHGGAAGSLNSVSRHWHAEVLRWILRALLLGELGIDSNEVDKRVLGRAGFQHALDQIRSAPPMPGSPTMAS